MERIAFLVDSTGERIDCMLNPETFEVRRLAGVRPHAAASGHLTGAGLSDDPLLFTGGGRTELVIDLVFDVDLIDGRAAPADVRTLTRHLWLLAENSAEERGGVRPPLIRLVWGKTWNVPAVVVAVAERFDAFDTTGVPRRSWLRVKLVRVAAATAQAMAASAAATGAGPVGIGGPAGGAVAAIGDGAAEPGFSGVRFDLLATEALGSPQRWRELADHNGIDNPLDVPAGAVLAVPSAVNP
ncbi:hypothetical protein GCM10009682_58270 [Luedemannella flava]|uniref:Contractile injection system tube protein N-terminal domain-containing protein n=1 Tax=Luedemannella flava TaxID=349316 RepID=A0ABP4YVD0_9ACTN